MYQTRPCFGVESLGYWMISAGVRQKQGGADSGWCYIVVLYLEDNATAVSERMTCSLEKSVLGKEFYSIT